MKLNRWAVLAVAAASLAMTYEGSASAAPAPAVFDFTVGSNYNISDGNARIFTATSSDLGVFKVRATGWSLEKVGQSTYVRDSKLLVYDGGLAVVSGDDNGGDNNQHTIDNEGRKDFVILQFDKPVALMSARFNTYSVLGYSKDSDATIKYGWSDLAWNSGLGLNNKNVSDLNALFDGSYTSLSPSNNGASNTRNINPNLHWGDIWLIGADFTNSDGRIDGFKITNLAVVPEPATWAMMIAGFGFVGAVARRRVRPQLA
ncbi:PEPxxWA-CTERM sorting domain-containing protein [Sphingomonas sp.]|jgi:hypothetical protein|uniref:PEPxxWA-CTERM sorting domain-containing protein n=1 Tax=Sphingomonas sp. TaxID=28214 RepID=UPI002DBBF3ED|nr:PEPxxWA-CTERM sorting domain-containing protein [Sphingomonas sp.]HEU4969598.1 PEPxxWA-CTERM sorting domain-containing protein [Sphingomonas sp.]